LSTMTQPRQAAATRPRLLLVDDDEPALRVLEQVLARHGSYELHSTTDSRQALARFREVQPDLVILDLHMPGLDGYAIVQQLQVRIPEGEFLPIVVLSGDLTLEAKQRALALGASEFLAKPFDLPEVSLRVHNLLRMREMNARLNERVRQQGTLLQQSEVELATRLALVSELCDYGDGDHVRRVGRTAATIAAQLGLDADTVHVLRYAAPLHDIGKTAIADAVLLKPDQLTLEEWDIMKTHTTLGARMLTGSRSPILQMAEEIALYHHEHWNGTGYTPGLGGEDIPLVARIVAVADVFDALTHARPYKKAWPAHEALDWIQSMSGSRFDAAVVDAMLVVASFDDLTRLPPDDFGFTAAPAPLPLLPPLPEPERSGDLPE
jgi:putative two-component system response regulator